MQDGDEASAPDPAVCGVSPGSGASQRSPGFHSGPPNSSSLGQRLIAQPVRGSTLYGFHQPPRSLTARRVPSAVHSTWATASSGPPSTVRGSARCPSSVTSATLSSVPSQGMRGWSHASQAAHRPSGESRGPVVNRYRSSVSSLTAARFPAAEPSSGTAAATRRTSVGAGPVNSSSTHQTSSPRSTGSAQRRPPPVRESGVRGRGPGLPGASGSYAYSRWSAKWTKTSRGPSAGRCAPAQGRPPYSVTRLRTFHGAGSSVISGPPSTRRRRTRVRRPSSWGRGSVHHTSGPTVPRYSGRPSSEAARAASMGEGQLP